MIKLYYSIREVSEIVGEEQHILRYWEKEFVQLKPKKNRGGNRTYSQKDIDTLLFIKKMMRDSKLSLKGARDALSKMNAEKGIGAEVILDQSLNQNDNDNAVDNDIENDKTVLSSSKESINVMTSDLKAIYILLKDTLKLIRI
ncbi:MAG: MerR family transcriptional regulator [Candidatus Kapabacteria bacterium]|nr:MerR family transcriptional regulator [Candidatus Kapabacteria bacterium]